MGGPKFRAFFSLSRRKFHSFFSLFVEFWWCLKRRGAQMCTLMITEARCECRRGLDVRGQHSHFGSSHFLLRIHFASAGGECLCFVVVLLHPVSDVASCQVPDGWLQLLRGPRPPSVKMVQGNPTVQERLSVTFQTQSGWKAVCRRATPSSSHEQAARANGRGCGWGDREVEGSDRSIGRFDGTRESTQGSPSSCPSTCFGASS